MDSQGELPGLCCPLEPQLETEAEAFEGAPVRPGHLGTGEPPACNRGGRAPAVAEWLRLQRVVAWAPERAGPALRAGHALDCILARFGRLPGGIPESRPGASHPEQRMLAAGPGRADRRDARRLTDLGGTLLPLGGQAYPPRLGELLDAPIVLGVRGEVGVLAQPCVAIIGARAATRTARDQAYRLAGDLAGQGIVIVSGLARGIDAEAHRGALAAGGRTVAVLACGIDRIYPPEHRGLAEEIAGSGAVISEMPLGTAPRRELFPLRNRIISGLSLGVVVVEARRRSGSLITVRHALNQGREVFVMPGGNEGPFAEGSNGLLREGARAIRSSADVLEDLGFEMPGRSPGVKGETSQGTPSRQTRTDGKPRAVVADTIATSDASEAGILAALREGPASREELFIRREFDPSDFARALVDLELSGRIMEERDGRFHLRWGAGSD